MVTGIEMTTKEKMTTTENTTVTVLTTSAKGAHLITDGQKVTWIKKAWLREDGSITPAAEKALADSNWTKDEYDTDGMHRKTRIAGEEYKVWSPNTEMTRLYFSDNSYIQIVESESTPGNSYYERHRYCKGERHAKLNITARGEIATRILESEKMTVANWADAATLTTVDVIFVNGQKI